MVVVRGMAPGIKKPLKMGRIVDINVLVYYYNSKVRKSGDRADQIVEYRLKELLSKLGRWNIVKV